MAGWHKVLHLAVGKAQQDRIAHNKQLLLTWVGVRVEVAMFQKLPEGALNAHIHKVKDAEACCIHLGLVRQLHTLYPLHAQHPSS